MKTVVVIMSSQLVDQEMRTEVGRIPPALIPVNGQPLYQAICEKFAELPGATEVCLVVNQGRDRVEEVVSREDSPKVQLVYVPQLADLGDAMCAALEQLPLSEFDNLILNFGDTLVDAEFDLSTDAVFYDDLEESYRWTTFTESKGRIAGLADKGLIESAEDSHVFTGTFLIKDGCRFLETLKSSSAQTNLSHFYTGLKNYLDSRDYKLTKVRQWYDFGHADNYYQTKKKFVNKRFFNDLKIDSERAIITKRSQNEKKLRAEIEWYKGLPSSLKCYAPQIYDCSTEEHNTWLSMEYYGYPTVAEIYLNSGHDLGIWSHLFKSLFGAIDRMMLESIKASPEIANAATKQMYVDKTLARLDAIREHEILGDFFSKPLKINGQSYRPLNIYLETLKKERELIEPVSDVVSVIHGDLCISNILYDPRSRILKLIDPRGEFGPWLIYGDYRYDLAKLSHSFNGHYELITHNLFFLMCEEREISLSLKISPYQEQVSAMFNGYLERYFSKDIPSIQLIEALLFLSMIPLHADHLNHQLAFMAVGLQKLEASFQQRGIRI